MKKIITIFAVVLVSGLSAFRCGNEIACCVMPPCSDDPSWEGTWRLTGYQNVSTGVMENDPDPEGKGVIFIYKDDKKIGIVEGHTVANTISGAYELTDGCLYKITSFGGTKVGEPAWSDKAWLPSGSAGSYVRAGNSLSLYRNDGKERMIFKKI